ncbi:Uncharacterised protein [uncultured archaeon]|nr:Uncharacterised protein [uncultured archaeon]
MGIIKKSRQAMSNFFNRQAETLEGHARRARDKSAQTTGYSHHYYGGDAITKEIAAARRKQIAKFIEPK